MSSSVPCIEAVNLSIASVSALSVATVLGIFSFGYYSYLIHKNPNIKILQTKYDVESASWVLILSTIAAMASGGITILNGICGEKCPTATLQCNTQMGTAGASLISALGIISAAIMKIISTRSQQVNNNISNFKSLGDGV